MSAEAGRGNYAKEMAEIMSAFPKDGAKKRLLLHACCAPCSSGVFERITDAFDVTVFFYNPNITRREEYVRRVEEEKRLIRAYLADLEREEREDKRPVRIDMIEGRYDPAEYLDAVSGLEQEPEGGARCEACFRLRLEESARVCADGGYDFFTTTLTISPQKNASLLNRIGAEAAKAYGVRFLPSDFKKQDGYRRSVELSKRYDLYRQDFCGCVFSEAARQNAR